jgi:ABC-2 type transport system ATP-binding protein
MSSIVHIHDLVVRYGKKPAVDHVNLEVPAGSVFALLGRNGAGKSSLVRCLLGEQRPQSGSIELFGEDVWKHRARLMERIGVVSEEGDAPPEMRVRDIARFSSKLYSRWDQPSVDARLRRFGVDRQSRFGDLSKGQKKHVSLAMALAASPELLVLDDPTLGLDVVARKVFFEEVIGELADRGLTILLTTHDLAGVETIADHVAVLKDGRIVLDEELETMKSRFRRIRFAAPMPVVTEPALVPAVVRRWGHGTEAIVTHYDELAFERFRSTSNVAHAEVSPMSLEEIFVAVAGEQEGAES